MSSAKRTSFHEVYIIAQKINHITQPLNDIIRIRAGMLLEVNQHFGNESYHQVTAA